VLDPDRPLPEPQRLGLGQQQHPARRHREPPQHDPVEHLATGGLRRPSHTPAARDLGPDCDLLVFPRARLDEAGDELDDPLAYL
jgi:hypothetical protein